MDKAKPNSAENDNNNANNDNQAANDQNANEKIDENNN